MKAISRNENAYKIRPALRLTGTKEPPGKDWLTLRKQGIGSSGASAAVGLTPYKPQLELWFEKTGRDATLRKRDPHDEKRPAYWGNILKPIVARHYSKHTRKKASELEIKRIAVGFDQIALDDAARRGFGNGAFEGT